MENTKKFDKRSKKYKEYKNNYETNKGVGDKVEQFTEATGIKALVHAIAGDNCGCEERKQTLNKIFGKFECLTEEEYEYLTTVFETKGKIIPEVQLKMKAIFERVYKKKLTASCLSCSFISEIYNPLKKIYYA